MKIWNISFAKLSTILQNFMRFHSQTNYTKHFCEIWKVICEILAKSFCDISQNQNLISSYFVFRKITKTYCDHPSLHIVAHLWFLECTWRWRSEFSDTRTKLVKLFSTSSVLSPANLQSKNSSELKSHKTTALYCYN